MSTGMSISIDPELLKPLVEIIVSEVLGRIDQPPAPMLSEPEAAALFGVDPHVLRDARKRGELECYRIGKFVRYDRAQLDAWKLRVKE